MIEAQIVVMTAGTTVRLSYNEGGKTHVYLDEQCDKRISRGHLVTAWVIYSLRAEERVSSLRKWH